MTMPIVRGPRRLGPVVLLLPLALPLGLQGCGDAETKDDPFGANIVRVGDSVAAQVSGTPIYVSDVRREGVAQGLIDRSEELSPGGQLYKQLLNELVDQRLLALEAARRGLDDNDDARRRVAAARERILGNILVETVVDSAVTEGAIRRMYEEQVDLVQLGDEVRARHILVATEQDAKEIAALLQLGGDFAQIALDRSRDQATRVEGGDLGYFSPETALSREIARVAFDLRVGQVSEPFEAADGWHILKVEDRRAQDPPSFEDMRPKIVRFMTFDEIQRLIDVLEKSAEVKLIGPEAEGGEEELGEPPSASASEASLGAPASVGTAPGGAGETVTRE